MKDIKEILLKLVEKYSNELRKKQLKDIPRISWHIELIKDEKIKKILDIGGGMGLFSIGCAALGKEVYLLDDFRDKINIEMGDEILELHRKYGVNIIKKDALKVDLTKIFDEESLDCVTSFDLFEHLHHSPRVLLFQIKKILKKGGVLIIGVPNAIDIFNRIKVLLGISPEARFEEWYFEREFRGHVREMTVKELVKIAKDLNFEVIKIIGKNWNLRSFRPACLCKFLDIFLGFFPNLCSDIYLISRKK